MLNAHVIQSKGARSLRLVLGILLATAGIPVHAAFVANDPVGDSTIVGAPDIVSIIGSYDSNYVYISGSFDPGSFNPANVGLLIGLDTDRNRNTGNATGFFPIGAEFTLNFTSTALTDPGRFRVRQWDTPTTNVLLGSVLPQFGTDQFFLAIPWRALGVPAPFDFGLAAGVPIGDRAFTPSDFVGDGPDYFLLGPATFETPSWAYDPSFAAVPEPSSSAILVVGLALIGFATRRNSR
jgi:hypothetical protein